jgi:hypothetical protein
MPRMISARATFSVLSVLVLGGCGSSSSSGGGSIAQADFAAESAKVTCHRVYTCCDSTERADNSSWGTSEADCVTMLTTENMTAFASFDAGITAGHITYHGDRAKTCLDNVAALKCSDWGVNFKTKYVTGCAHIFDGTVAMGAACTLDEECATGFCGAGMCAARGALGDACTAPTGCQDGLYCPVSAGDHCATVAAVGGACQVSVSCQNNSCVIPDGQTMGTCGTPLTCDGQ